MACLLMVGLCAVGAEEYYSGGTGDPNNPYRIAKTADWQQLMYAVDDWDKHFVLTFDLDMNDVAMTPVGSSTHPFAGAFDGNDHIIRNVDINTPDGDYVGLFGRLDPGSRLHNLGVENASIAGRNQVGGLAGYKYDGSITDCRITGSVTGNRRVGGLAGWNIRGMTADCEVTVSVRSLGDYAGGLAGDSVGSVSNCYAAGPVDGNNHIGGLIGHNGWGSISHCYAAGTVSAITDYAGGLVGSNDGGAVINCYSAGSVRGNDHIGGLVGSDNPYGSVSRSYFLHPDDGGGADNGLGIALTDALMRQQASFVGWDFLGQSDDGTSEIWQMPTDGGYPVLSSLNRYTPPVLGGDGTANNPYLISDPEELGAMYHYDRSAWYRMTADINLSGISWSASPIPALFGTFDGNDHVIRNLVLNVPDGDDVGLFGYVGFGAEISNTGIEDASIAGRRFVGSLAGYNYDGDLSNCSVVNSAISGQRDIGGLAGYNCYGSISNCYVTGSVDAEDRSVGGLAGRNHGSIRNCYAAGPVNSKGDHIGGLVGWNKGGDVTACYAAGPVSGAGYVGGLAGLNSADGGGSSIADCYATGLVKGNNHVGGLAGENYNSSISNSYATGPVRGNYRVGGLAGYNAHYAAIENSYSTGTVDGNDCVGGLVGSNACSGIGPSTISNCYTVGPVNGTGYSVGGLAGSNCFGTITRVYFLHPDDGGGPDNGIGEALTDSQMRWRISFIDWDFAGDGDGDQDIWSICEGTNYPRLVRQIPLADWLCPDGVGLEDFSHLGQVWGDALGSEDPVNLDGNPGIGFGDLLVLSEQWFRGR
ncbi:MAG: hypothetical protein JW720_11555 [Sedimentisphaerales bacterium]|nr:hypothetical protein [Sedimentisphaerales bacterium]